SDPRSKSWLERPRLPRRAGLRRRSILDEPAHDAGFRCFPDRARWHASLRREQPGRRCRAALCDELRPLVGPRPGENGHTERPGPPVFVAPAIFLAAVFVALHLIGAREHVSILSGTAPSSHLAAAAGLLYVAAWFCAVVVAPVLAIAAGLFGIAARAAAFRT